MRFASNQPEQKAAQLLGVDNGAADEFTGEFPYKPYRQPNYGNWFRLAMFLVLVLLPLPWVWIHPHRPTARAAGQPAERNVDPMA